MKVIVFYLAFLIIIFSFFPFALSACTNEDSLSSNMEISLYDKENDKIVELNLEEYILGVVSAEMPADFSKEALKAQAVAARTYSLRKINKSLPEHKGADLCSDFAHCQAYSDTQKLKQKWKKDYKKNITKIKNSVKDTMGEYLWHNNDFAITVFHSCSNGITEKASDVWSTDVPYLINVTSEGDYLKKDYETKCEYTHEEFISKINDFLKTDVDTSLEPIGDVQYTSGNNVAKINIFGNVLTGSDIRSIFSLKSTSFELKKDKDKFIFTVFGNGHGVGMSQYGAEKMARDGLSYKNILSHYYPQTSLKKLNN